MTYYYGRIEPVRKRCTGFKEGKVVVITRSYVVKNEKIQAMCPNRYEVAWSGCRERSRMRA